MDGSPCEAAMGAKERAEEMEALERAEREKMEALERAEAERRQMKMSMKIPIQMV